MVALKEIDKWRANIGGIDIEVVRVVEFGEFDVGFDDGIVIADGLNPEELRAWELPLEFFGDELPSGFGGIGAVVDADVAFVLEKVREVFES